MIPPVESHIWVELVKNERRILSQYLAVNLVIARARHMYNQNPSEETLAAAACLAHTFFCRYEQSFLSEVAQLLNN